MNEEILFKYRSAQNWKVLLDIFLEKRKYAAAYKELNVPMEGRYYYHSDRVSREFKRALRICSLSRNHRNTLMWSYYADGHRDFAIGVPVRSPRRTPYLVRPVTYDMEVHAGGPNRDPAQVALEILSQKQFGWQHAPCGDAYSASTMSRNRRCGSSPAIASCTWKSAKCALAVTPAAQTKS